MFIHENFLLQTDPARQLYHEFARSMPIIDYHCHLPPDQIAADTQFQNLTQIWLYGDHYKWRAMRTNGIDERYCTGEVSDREKFQKWAETVPYTVRNPLYHWTHLELQRYFGITELLDGRSAERIYDHCNEQLNTPDFSVRNLLLRMNVRVVCTTDDPTDSLTHHRQLADDRFAVRVLPTFRADRAMAVDDAPTYNAYLTRLEAAADVAIHTYDDLLSALQNRHDFFAAHGCKLSDHGLEQLFADDYTEADVRVSFAKIRAGVSLSQGEINGLKSALLVFLAEMDYAKGWTQQFHLGALRNNNTRKLRELGPDTGWDSVGDFSQARALSRFMGGLDDRDKLAKMILYNLNPADNEVMATMAGNFNDGTVPGKVQFGSGWWFLDQKKGMENQIDALSNMGLLSRFVGMLTDSRSFMSFPRHEYFRRVLCNMIGNDVANGELPATMDWLGEVMQNICYNNANTYFGFDTTNTTGGQTRDFRRGDDAAFASAALPVRAGA